MLSSNSYIFGLNCRDAATKGSATMSAFSLTEASEARASCGAGERASTEAEAISSPPAAMAPRVNARRDTVGKEALSFMAFMGISSVGFSSDEANSGRALFQMACRGIPETSAQGRINRG